MYEERLAEERLKKLRNQESWKRKVWVWVWQMGWWRYARNCVGTNQASPSRKRNWGGQDGIHEFAMDGIVVVGMDRGRLGRLHLR